MKPMTPDNLMPFVRLHAKQRAARVRCWVKGVSMYGLTLLALTGTLYWILPGPEQAIGQELGQLQTQIQAIRERDQAIRPRLEQARKVLGVSATVTGQPDWSILLAALAKSLDDEVVLSQCRLNKKLNAAASNNANTTPLAESYTLSIRGFGRSQDAVSLLANRLESYGLFNSVTLVKATSERYLTGNAIAFVLDCSLGSQPRGGL